MYVRKGETPVPHFGLGIRGMRLARSTGTPIYGLFYARSWLFGMGYVPLSAEAVNSLDAKKLEADHG